MFSGTFRTAEKALGAMTGRDPASAGNDKNLSARLRRRGIAYCERHPQSRSSYPTKDQGLVQCSDSPELIRERGMTGKYPTMRFMKYLTQENNGILHTVEVISKGVSGVSQKVT